MTPTPNDSVTLLVLRAIASINGERSVKPLARMDEIREQTGVHHLRVPIMWLIAEGCIEYIDAGRLDGYVITTVGKARLVAMAEAAKS